MNKQQCKRELFNVETLYVVGFKKGTSWYPNSDRYQWRRFHIYYIKENKLFKLHVDSDVVAPNWRPIHKTRSGYTTGGHWLTNEQKLNRPQHIVEYIGRWLFEDPQRFKCRFLNE